MDSTGKCSVFFHPDYTVGTVIATVRASKIVHSKWYIVHESGLRTLPPIGNFTLP